MKHVIGEWRFDPESGELLRGGEVRRLEPRAARALELLCESAGSVVSHDRLIGEVWGGRSLSDNSVSVVIGQLRRALGDEEKRLIENVPKRGYRLAAGPAAAEGRSGGANGRIAALALVPALVAAVAVVGLARGSSLPEVTVADVSNETGDAAYGPHARATSELIVDELSKRGFEVRRAGQGSEFVLQPRLVMWNGRPYLGMTATSPDGVVRWSAMMPGAPGEVPDNAKQALGQFEEEISSP